MTLYKPDAEGDVDSYVAINVVRHRRVVGAFALLCACDSGLEALMRNKKIRRNPVSFEQFAERLSDRHFKSVLRMPRVSFFGLCDLLVDYYRQSKRVVRKTGLSVPVCLSMTLRWIAGGSYLDICLWHNVSLSTFYQVVDNVKFDLDSILKIEFPFTSADYVASASRGFSRSN